MHLSHRIPNVRMQQGGGPEKNHQEADHCFGCGAGDESPSQKRKAESSGKNLKIIETEMNTIAFEQNDF